MGIEPEPAERIFERFARGENARQHPHRQRALARPGADVEPRQILRAGPHQVRRGAHPSGPRTEELRPGHGRGDRVERAGETLLAPLHQPPRQVPHVDALHRVLRRRRCQHPTSPRQAHRPVGEPTAGVAGSDDQAWTRDQAVTAGGRGDRLLAGHLVAPVCRRVTAGRQVTLGGLQHRGVRDGASTTGQVGIHADRRDEHPVREPPGQRGQRGRHPRRPAGDVEDGVEPGHREAGPRSRCGIGGHLAVEAHVAGAVRHGAAAAPAVVPARRRRGRRSDTVHASGDDGVSAGRRAGKPWPCAVP